MVLTLLIIFRVQLGRIFGYLANSGDFLVVIGGRALLASGGVGARDPPTILQCTGQHSTPTTEDYLAPASIMSRLRKNGISLSLLCGRGN
jgi:hypothetical protein